MVRQIGKAFRNLNLSMNDVKKIQRRKKNKKRENALMLKFIRIRHMRQMLKMKKGKEKEKPRTIKKKNVLKITYNNTSSKDENEINHKNYLKLTVNDNKVLQKSSKEEES